MFKLTLAGETVIFLDFDGPLLPARMHYEEFNSTIMFDDTMSWQDSHELKVKIRFDPVVISMLNRWVEQAPAKVVISSNWSKYASKEQIIEYLVGNGFKFPDQIHEDWCLHKHKSWSRGDEISHWLSNHRGEIKNYLILDDDFSVLNTDRLDDKKVLFIDFFDGMSWNQIFKGFEIFGITDY